MKHLSTVLSFYSIILCTILLFCYTDAFSLTTNKEIPAINFPLEADTTHLTICNNQLPYQWNGITCLNAGIYSATLTGSGGEDSLAVLDLGVINVATSITNANVCDNNLPYYWNGNSYTSNGTYSVTLTSSSGCDSVPILSLTVNQQVTSTTNRIVCSNQLPYNWNSNNYILPGTYSVTLTSAAGCDSIATLNLSIKPVSSSTTSVVLCTAQLPYYWNGISYPAAGNYSITLTAANGCDSTAVLQLAVTTASFSNNTAAVCNNRLPYVWNGQSYSGAGNYAVTLTAGNGCDSVAMLSLTVLPVKTSLTYVTICDGQLPYTWNGVSYTVTGLHSVTLTGSNGCDSIATIRIVSVPVLTSTTNHTSCSNTLPYSWNGNLYTTAGVYSVPLVNASGCDSVATLNLIVQFPEVKPDSIIICENQLPYHWHGYTFTTGGTYPLMPVVTLDACHAVDTLVLTVLVIPPSITNVHICTNNLPYSWNGNSYPGTGTYDVILTSSSGCDSTATLNLSVGSVSGSTTNTSICINQIPYYWNGITCLTGGTYTAIFDNASGCDSVTTLNLTVNPVQTSTTDLLVCSTQVPYNWNGMLYTTSGTYTATLNGSNNCDSIATLHLIVQSFLSSSTNIVICSNQLPYNWNNNVYITSGNYSINLTSGTGCDSIAMLNLLVNDVITSTSNINICISQLPYNWNGNMYLSGGIYTVTLNTTTGCDSIAILNLSVNPIVTSNTSITICNNQLPFAWNGNSYPAAGVFPVTLTGSNGCDSIATLNLMVTDILTSTTNVTVCPFLLPYQWNGNSYSTGGTYSVTLATTAGCDSVPILSLTIAPYVESSVDVTICNSQLPYLWNGNSYSTAGNYSVLITGMNICDSLVHLNLSVQPIPVSSVTVNICESELPYSWNGNNYSLAGTYVVTLTSAEGCDSIATLVLGTYASVASVTDVRICSNQLPYNWNGNSYTVAGTYAIILTSSNGCDSTATLNLTANSTVNSLTQVNICISQLPYSWNGNSYPVSGTYVITLTSSGGCDSIATLELLASTTITSTTVVSLCNDQLPYTWNGNNYPVAGTYQVMLTGSGGCDSVAVLQLLINPVVTSATAVSVCITTLPYIWNGNVYTDPGTYYITLTGSSGCDSIAALQLTVNETLNSTTDVYLCDAAFPYTWNGNVYPVAGNYSITLTGGNGCDSIAGLNLMATHATFSTTAVNICSNQLPYSWGGNIYPDAGTYSVTVTGSNACDSVATLQLTANDIVTSATEVNICNNQLPYTWNGNAYTAAGIYYITLTGSSGCDSIASLHLISHATVISLTTINICSNQFPYNWNGNTYPVAGTYAITLTSSSGCDSVATLLLGTYAAVGSLTEVSACQNQLPFVWNGQQYNTSGLHTVILTSSTGCDSTTTLNLIILPLAQSFTNAHACTNELPYLWNSQQYTGSGTYTANLTGINGCDSIATLLLVIDILTYSTTSASICSANLPFTWNGQSYSTAGVHTVILTNTAGCDSVASLNLVIHTSPLMPLVQSPVSYCQFDTTSLLVAAVNNPADHLLWYSSASGGTASLDVPLPSASVPGTVNYFVSEADSFCESARAMIQVIVNIKPALGPDKQVSICFGQSANLLELYNTTGYASSWTSGSQPLGDPAHVTTSGAYQLIVQNNNGCVDTAIINLAIHPLIIANAGADADAETNVPYQLSGSGGGSHYQWSPEANLNNPYIPDPLATLNHDQTFVLMVSDDIGCFGLDTVKLRVLNGPTFYVPSAFTPNGDGMNDVFQPTPIGISSLEFFRVFNRYGELVYETSEIGKGWDGTYRGIRQNTGNYVWSLKGTDRLGNIKLMKGNVVLIR